MLKHFIFIFFALLFMEGCVERGMVPNLPEQSIKHTNIAVETTSLEKTVSNPTKEATKKAMEREGIVDYLKDDSIQNTISGIMVFLIALALIV